MTLTARIAQSQTAQSRTTPDRRWLALVVIAVAQLVAALDATIVNIALPTAQRSLAFDDGDRAWVVTAYTLSFAGLLLLSGRIADQVGRRRALLTGLAGFAVSSALAGAAVNLGMLVAGRALQGAFASLMAPAGLSMLAVLFTDQRERAKAFGVFGAVASSGAAVGLLLGGVLTEYLGWRWCLFVNVPVAAAALAAGRRYLPVQPPAQRSPLDVLSGVLATSGLVGVVLGCSQAATRGWDSWQVLGPLVAGVGLLAGFVARQATADSPLLPLRVLADRDRAAAYLSTGLAVVGSFGMFLMLTYHFQVVLGYTPVQAGLAFLPMTAAVSASAYGLASRLLYKVRPGVLVVPGLLATVAGLALLCRLEPSSGYLTLILPAEVLVGAGMGCIFTPSFAAATRNIEPRLAGVAAAVINTATQVGGSVGTAVLNTVAITATAAVAGQAASPAVALVHGFAVATAWAAVALLVGAGVVTVLFSSRGRAGR